MARETFLEYRPGPNTNPLKGFMPFAKYYRAPGYRPAFPHSLEWVYVPLNALMTGDETFTFEQGLEPILTAVQSRGHQVCLRVYLDYPAQPSGIPDFLRAQGLALRPYQVFGGGTCPDYRNPRLIAALERFVQAFGARYDGDARIGFITAGLIGFWGEWHTYPYNGVDEPEDWMPTVADQERILEAYVTAFRHTHILVRYPLPASLGLSLGYHDDSFAWSTIGSDPWCFQRLLEAANRTERWRTLPIGGELRPELQNGIWEESPPDEAEDFAVAVQATHASWLINQGVFRPEFQPTGAAFARALAAHRQLGYELHVRTVGMAAADRGLNLTLRLENRGVAPFYYDWPVQIGRVYPGASHPDDVVEMPWRLRDVLPGPVVTWAGRVPWDSAQSRFRIVLRVANPMPEGVPFAFANREQDQDLPGWLTLSS